MQSSNATRSAFHYGWWVVVGGFLTQFILMTSLQALPLNLAQVEKTLHITHAAAGAITATFGGCYGLFSFFWGYLADKYGPRLALALAGSVVGIAYIIFGSQVTTLTQAIVLYGFVGFGAAGIYSATIPKLVGAWFVPQQRGKVTSFITPGGTITGAILGFLCPFLTVHFGWQTSLVILGAICIAVSLVIYLLVRNSPAEKGLTPYGSPPDAPVQVVKATQKNNLADFIMIAKRKITWHMSAMFICWQFPYMISTAFLVLSFIKAELTVAQAGVALVIYKIFTLIGQWIWGPLSDKMERKTVIAISCVCWAISGGLYTMVWGQGATIMYITVAVMGIGTGIVPVILAAFSDYYEPEYRGTGNGVISTLGSIGRFAGPLAAGFLADAYGMPAAFVLAAVAMVCAAGIALTLPKLRDKKPAAATVAQ